MGAKGANVLTSKIASLSELKVLELDLFDNQIGEQGASDLFDNIAKIKGLNHLSLCLGHNKLSTESVKHMSVAL